MKSMNSMKIKEIINAELDQRGWSVQRLADESGVRYASLIEFLNKDKGLMSQNIDKALSVLSNSNIVYELKQEILENDANIELRIIDGIGRLTQYSPVIFAVYEIDEKKYYYTESKTGEMKHLYSIKERSIVDTSIIDLLEPVFEVIDYQRF